MLENVGAWNGTGGFWKHQSRENIGVQETSECRIGKHQSMENIRKHQKTSEMLEMSETSEYGIGRHWKHQKCQSVKQEWKFEAEFKMEYGYITMTYFSSFNYIIDPEGKFDS